MVKKSTICILSILIMLSLLLTSCAPSPAPATSPEDTTEDKITEVNIAVITGSTIEQPYVKSLINAFDRFNTSNKYGLKINYKYTENSYGDDAERAMRTYADTGEYDIIWAHESYSDQAKNMMNEYPEIMFVIAGSGNTGLGGNVYFVFAHLQECAYLQGVAAAMMTKTNVVGAVAGYPYEDVNDVLNGFKDGVKSVNEEIKVKISFIESWYDPPKAKETTYALMAAGADIVYAERLGPFEALAEKGLLGFGNYEDQYEMAPDVVITSALLKWEPHVDYIISEWLGHKVDGKPWNGTIEPVWFGYSDGGCELAPINEKVTPQEVRDELVRLEGQLKDGSLKVILNIEPPVSD
jgi:basic membrane lipoprotein Med (substrate-binding protein (PBP1-ABC) superfamily)